MKAVKYIKKNYDKVIIYCVAAVFLVVMLGLVLFPEFFYEQWIWKYYWGPVVADAQDGVAFYNGVKAVEGYTYLSEVTYGFILILALYGIYRLLKKLEVVVDWHFALALLPYIVFGPVARTLEDSGFFSPPWVYWFISPLIYLQIGLFAIFFVLLGYYLQKNYKHKFLKINNVVFVGGVCLLLPSLFFVAKWILGDGWGDTSDVRFDVFLIVMGLVSLITFLVFLFSYFMKNKDFSIPFRNPLNLALIFGHQLDGITTYLSIKDPLNLGLSYVEKHPASDSLLNIWGPLFPVTKFVLIIVVIYLFDILYKDELRGNLTLVNLLKIGILILGFSPGLRGLLRVTMGV
jgi:uncharacterized membrane protein